MKTPTTLSGDSHWAKMGARSGRRNLPGTPDGDAPARSVLISVWDTQLRQARATFVQETARVDHKRAALQRRVADVRAAASSDPRQAGAVAAAQAQQRAADAERETLHVDYLALVQQISNDARTSDAAWRAGNQAARDRRIDVAPTNLPIPDGLLDPVPDPLGH